MGSRPVGISGSRAAAILGLSQWQTQFEVWQLLCEERRQGFNAERGYLLPEPPDNAAIRFGTAFESAIVELAEAKRGKAIGDRERFYAWGSLANIAEPILQRNGIDFRAEVPEITCHVDGIYADAVLHEGKTTSLFNYWEGFGTPGTDHVPQNYQVQCQHQLLCTGARKAIVSVLVFPRRPDEWEAEGWYVECDDSGWLLQNDERRIAVKPFSWAVTLMEMGLFHQYPCAVSPSLQKLLVDTYSHFWHTFVIPEKEPELSTYEDLKRAFPQPVGTIVATDQVERWAREYGEIGSEIGASGRLAKRRDELRLLILRWMRSQDSVFDDESRERTVLRDQKGNKLVQWNGKIFRT